MQEERLRNTDHMVWHQKLFVQFKEELSKAALKNCGCKSKCKTIKTITIIHIVNGFVQAQIIIGRKTTRKAYHEAVKEPEQTREVQTVVD